LSTISEGSRGKVVIWEVHQLQLVLDLLVDSPSVGRQTPSLL
jgi:hypothetical protein